MVPLLFEGKVEDDPNVLRIYVQAALDATKEALLQPNL
jgi:hypothetical protein